MRLVRISRNAKSLEEELVFCKTQRTQVEFHFAHSDAMMLEHRAVSPVVNDTGIEICRRCVPDTIRVLYVAPVLGQEGVEGKSSNEKATFGNSPAIFKNFRFSELRLSHTI